MKTNTANMLTNKGGITLGGLFAQGWRQLSPEQIAQHCLKEAGNDLDRARVLAGRYTYGPRQREVNAAICNAFLHASAPRKEA
jgi:hypothetical protein